MHTFPELVAAFDTRFAALALPNRPPQTLYEPLRQFLAIGGKRVRPVLCLMAAELLGPIQEDAWNAALAIELFHNFTLVHDDIMDEAPLRRGHPTVHARYGLTSGILGGDALCILAYDYLSQIRKPLQPILEVFNHTALEVCEGQQLDMDFEKQTDVSVADYIEMIRLKTSVLLGGALKIGALLGGASIHVADKLYQFGQSLGIAFQLQDDYLDAFGESDKTGKQPGGDILADKKTFLHLHTLSQNVPGYPDALRQTNPETKIAAVRSCFEISGAQTRCREEVTRYSNEAMQALEDLTIVSARKKPLEALSAFLLDRNY
ncbi:MAG: polyprenyl synthetase family protein [Sphingobacteriales bacterium]|nr:MAG: polyprenyl synthetase family protein [Sphingobacteriales bacterium]